MSYPSCRTNLNLDRGALSFLLYIALLLQAFLLQACLSDSKTIHSNLAPRSEDSAMLPTLKRYATRCFTSAIKNLLLHILSHSVNLLP